MEIFGLNISRKKKNDGTKNQSFVSPTSDDGTSLVQAGGYFGTYVDVEGAVKNEADLIRRYRDISTYPDCDLAIEDIVSETISALDDEESVSIILDDVKLSDSIKNKIIDEFDDVMRLLDFNSRGHDIFRRWYIDGRLYYQKIVDVSAPRKGITELRYIDPRKIRKIKEVQREMNADGISIIKETQEYFVYSERGLTPGTNGNPNMATGDFSTKGIRINVDAITYVTSGLIDLDRNVVLSYLHKAIKPVNSLRMMEDALVIYRMSRAPERRIFYIDVGRLPTAKAEQYVKDIMVKYRNKVVYDAQTGEIRDDRKHMCLAMDTKVPLLDGRVLTIYEIAKEYNEGKTLWAYSCDPITGKFVPGLISWAGETRKNAEVVRITLDNGKSIVCTPDHKFPVWNKGFVEAKDLTVGESMMPHYTRESKIQDSNPYLQLFDNEKKKWQFVHRLVSTWKDEQEIINEFVYHPDNEENDKKTVHHINFNKTDNSPYNLVRMNSADHVAYHQSLLTKEEMSDRGRKGGLVSLEQKSGIHGWTTEQRVENGKAIGHIGGAIGGKISYETQVGVYSEESKLSRKIGYENMLSNEESYVEWKNSQLNGAQSKENRDRAKEVAIQTNLSARGNSAKKEMFNDEQHRLAHRNKYRVKYTKNMLDVVANCASSATPVKQVMSLLNENLDGWVDLNRETPSAKGQKKFDKVCKEDIKRIVEDISGLQSYNKYKEALQFRNHKIAKIEFLADRIDTGCITIDGDEIFHGHHTFALDVGIYTKNSMLEDFWLPRQEGGKGTEITTLPGGENLGQIDDVVYFQKKLYQALNVPLTRLNPEQSMAVFGRQSEVSRDELKFNKFISRLRKKFSELFNDLLKTNLILKGIITDQDWEIINNQIRYDFNQDEYFAEVKEGEVLRSRLDLLNQIQPYVGIYYSQDYVQRKILKLSDKDIEQMSADIKRMAAEQEEQQINQEQEQASIPQGNQDQDQGQQMQQGFPSPLQQKGEQQ